MPFVVAPTACEVVKFPVPALVMVVPPPLSKSVKLTILILEPSVGILRSPPLTTNLYPGPVVPMPTLPFCLMTKRFNPEEEAVKISPTPELSTTRVAKEEVADIVAAGVIPSEALTSSLAKGEVVPRPRLSVRVDG